VLTLSVVFLGGTYEASDGAGPEWPPHPGRVFNALVAQADPGTADDSALTWLEEQAPPVVLASEAHGSVLTAFVPTNSVKAGKDTHQTYLGRTAGSRSWSRANPRRTEVHFFWPDATPGEEVRRRLAILARRVPYLGRATSPVVVSVGIDEPEDTVGSIPVMGRLGCGPRGREASPTSAPPSITGSRPGPRTASLPTVRRGPRGKPLSRSLTARGRSC